MEMTGWLGHPFLGMGLTGMVIVITANAFKRRNAPSSSVLSCLNQRLIRALHCSLSPSRQSHGPVSAVGLSKSSCIIDNAAVQPVSITHCSDGGRSYPVTLPREARNTYTQSVADDRLVLVVSKTAFCLNGSFAW